MEVWIIRGIVVMFLIINACLDWEKQEVSLGSIGIFGLIGMGITIGLKPLAWGSVLGGGLLGVAVCLLAFLTKEAIGIGDGLIVTVLGIFLGFWETFLLLLVSSVCCAGVMSICFLLKKIQKDSRFPFVPFLLVAYLGRMLC